MPEEFVKVLVRLPKDLKEKLDQQAAKERRTVTNLIVVLLEQELNKGSN